MAPDGPTNIKVFVRWEEQNVFAGEEVKCNITFRNVARIPGSTSRGASAANGASSRTPGGPILQRQLSSQTLAQARANNGKTLAPPPSGPGRGGHRGSTSMSIPSSRPPVRTGSGSWTPTSNTSDGTSSRNGHTHRRSMSIVSLGSASTIDEPSQLLSSPAQKNQRPARGHTRSASLQIVSRGPLVNGPRSGEPSLTKTNETATWLMSYILQLQTRTSLIMRKVRRCH
jgi:RAB6A-GEF complex partner protein 2